MYQQSPANEGRVVSLLDSLNLTPSDFPHNHDGTCNIGHNAANNIDLIVLIET